MKILYSFTLFFIFFTAIAQDYSTDWRDVAGLESDGLVRSANEAVTKIHNKALRDKNEPQIIKSLLFLSRYTIALEEEAQKKTLLRLQDTKKQLSPAGAAFVESIFAESLDDIYSSKRYNTGNRINLNDPVIENIAAWGPKNFQQQIAAAYSRSLENREHLYNTPLSKYSAVVELNTSFKNTGRSLYDFLAERSLNGSNGVSRLYNAGKEFDALVAAGPEFTTFILPDSIRNFPYEKVRLLQDLEVYYAAKNDENALKNAIIRRLVFGYLILGPEASEKYLETLSYYVTVWDDNSPFTSQAMLARAFLYHSLADKTELPDYNIKAVHVCDALIKRTSTPDIAEQAQELKNKIDLKNAVITLEKYAAPGKPMLALVEFQNTAEVTVRIYRNPYRGLYPFEEKDEKHDVDELVYEHRYVMPPANDYLSHTTEIIIPPLEKGRYIVETEPSTNEKSQTRAAGFEIVVTGLSVLDGRHDGYYILERASGKPVHKAKIISGGETFYTDRSGLAKVKAKETNNFTDIVIYSGDTIVLYNQYHYKFTKPEKEQQYTDAKATVYFDRAIYRPGQTVYFKGIVVAKTGYETKVVPNVYVSVLIDDADGNELAEMRLPTNEFGSFTGTFDIPKNVMTGEFYLSVDEDLDYEEDEHPFWDNENIDFHSDRFSFRVEEYKRPTFEIEFNRYKETATVNDTITVTGKAMALNGSPLSNIRVKYSVTRDTRIADNHYYRDSAELDEGEVLTDEKGSFTIAFTTEPDPDAARTDEPIFRYVVKAVVTDAAGETHDTQTTVNVGYHTMNVKAQVPAEVVAGDESELLINSRNLNDQEVAAQRQVTIYRLTPGNIKVYAERPWPYPEVQAIPEAEFRENFPYIPYSEADVNVKQEREGKVFSQTFDAVIGETALKPWAGNNWQEGDYEVVVTAVDESGNKREVISRFRYLKSNLFSGAHILKYRVENSDFANDGFVALRVYTALPSLYIRIDALNGSKNVYKQLQQVTQGNSVIKIPVKKNWPEINVRISYLWQNNLSYQDITVSLNLPQSQPAITASVIKDKLLPGAPQTWSFTLTNSKSYPAEVLATMYDASLDQFEYAYWENLSASKYTSGGYHPRFYNYTNGNENSYRYRNQYPKFIPRNPDLLKTFGFNINDVKIKYYTVVPDNAPAIIGAFEVKGTVSDDVGPLPGASVLVVGTNRSVQTDIDGKYSIQVRAGEKLEFSYVGMQSQLVTLRNSYFVNVTLTGTELNEVVKDLYRTTRTAKSTASISTLSVVTVEHNILKSLQGQVAGLNISYNAAAPGGSTILLRGVGSMNGNTEPLFVVDGIPIDEDGFRSIRQDEIASYSILKDAEAIALYGNRGANGVIIISTFDGLRGELEALEKVVTRKNLKETAFFYPDIRTDKKGNFSFSFTTPEALTSWNMRLLAHNKKAQSASFSHLAYTSKDLMIMPNMPRFLREGDQVVIKARVTNTTSEAKTGNAMLQLFDATTMQPLTNAVVGDNAVPFSLAAKGTEAVSWTVTVPAGIQGIQYRVTALSGTFSDGEENIIPVLSNRMLVTETVPLWVKPDSEKTFTLQGLKANESSTLINHALTFEYTSNPAWLALQSLPYLMEFEHECSEQLFARIYANAIASHIINQNPGIAKVFEEWRKAGKELSKLEQNEELKSVIMAESPWMMEAQSDAERKNRMALLFDLNRMAIELNTNISKLGDRQSGSGAFPWFTGGDDNEFITRHIVAGLGHLKKLGINLEDAQAGRISKKAISYLDSNFYQRYAELPAAGPERAKKIGYGTRNALHYLYARSFYGSDYPVTIELKSAIDEYLLRIKADWKDYSLYDKALAALVLSRFEDAATAKKIVNSLKETSASNDEYGMYWISNKPGWYWYNSPIETQALLIEAFTEVANDTASAEAMKVWLIRQKQTKNWPTTKSTTEAVYALLMQGADWLQPNGSTTIKLGNKDIVAETAKTPEAGTGYIKTRVPGKDVTPDMATVHIANKSKLPGYGGLYWQYFEDISKIKPAQEGLLNISRDLYIAQQGGKGQPGRKLGKSESVSIGDRITVVLTVTAAEDLEYLHLKDVRAAALEPADVLSGHEYRDGIGYYRSTRDAATHFFFDRLPKGTYVLQYDVVVNNAGEFSNGISSIQSMYAPEFSGHSEGLTIKATE